MDRLYGCAIVLVLAAFLLFGLTGVLWVGAFSIPIGIALFIFGKLVGWT